MMHYSIHEEEENEALFTFLETALLWLDAHDEIANFHLIFLLEATKYLGFYPDTTNIDLPYFEMTEGIFTPFNAISSLSNHETQLFKKLLELKFESDLKTFHVIERQILLKILIDYYSFHLEGFRKPKSLDVLKEVFS
jgi:DNA repair protein RecO (recombination protein O)